MPIASTPKPEYLPGRRHSAVITLRWMPIQCSEQVKEDLLMRELNFTELSLVGGADGEDDSGGEVNQVCDTLGDASAAATSVAIITYSGWSGPLSTFAATTVAPVVNSTVEGGCQSLCDATYALTMYLIDSALDNTWNGLTGETW